MSIVAEPSDFKDNVYLCLKFSVKIRNERSLAVQRHMRHQLRELLCAHTKHYVTAHRVVSLMNIFDFSVLNAHVNVQTALKL